MEFHPSQLPVSKTFEVRDEVQASQAVAEMVKLGFAGQKSAYRVLMTNDKNIAKKIGFVIMDELNFGLRKTKQERDVMYWIYHYDSLHYAMVLISSKVLQELGF